MVSEIMEVTYLLKKFRRELLQESGAQLLSLIIIVTIGIACFIGFFKTYNDLNTTFHTYYEHSNLADMEVSGRFNSNMYRQIKNVSGVEAVTQNFNYQANRKNTILMVNGYSRKSRINQPKLLRGKEPQKGEIVLDHLYMDKNRFKIGDHIKLVINGTQINVRISGAIRSPKYLYFAENAVEPVPNHKKHGYALISNEQFKEMTLPANLIEIKIQKSSNLNQVADRMRIIDPNLVVLTKTDLPSYNMIYSKLNTIKNISVAISTVFIILTAAVTLISYFKQISNKRGEIAIFKALGVPKQLILFDLFLPGIITATIGTVIGSLLGLLVIPKVINRTLATLFDFPPIVHRNYLFFVLGSFLIVLLVEFIALIVSSVKLLNKSAAKTMRPNENQTRANTFLAKMPLIWLRFSFTTKLLARNIASGRVKFFLSTVVIAFCAIILVSAFGLKLAFGDIAKTEFSDTRKYNISANLNSANTKIIKIAQNPSVQYADNFSIVPIKFKKSDTHLNVINQAARAISLVTGAKEKLKFNHLHGVYLSAKLAQKLRQKKGDKVHIRVLSNNQYKDIEVLIKGIYISYLSQGMYTTYEYLKSKKITIPVQTKFIKATKVKAEEKQLKSNPLLKNILLKTKQKRSYQNASNSINTILVMIVIFAALLLFAVIYNISTISIAERKRDIANEKVLGLNNVDINMLFLKENAIMVTLATTWGIALSPSMYKLLANSIASDDMSFPSQFNMMSVPISVTLIVLFLLLTSFFLTRRINRIDQLEALNGFE